MPKSTVTLVSSGIGTGGGIERVFSEFVLYFSGEGYGVNAICREIDRELAPNVSRLEVVAVPRGDHLLARLVYQLVWLFSASYQLRRLGDRKGVVIGHPGSAFPLDIVMAGSCHLAALFEVWKDGKWVWLFNPMNWLIVLSERQAFKRKRSTIMVPSTRTGNEIHQIYGIPQARIAVVPHGVDVSFFKPARDLKHAQDSRCRFGLPSDKLMLLSVVNELERKGCFLVLESLHLLKAKGVNCHYAIAGRADYTKFRAQADLMGLLDMVTFLPPTMNEDLVALYQAADLFVLPTKYESFGLVCMEALACGLPVVSCQVGGVEDYVTHGDDGALVPRTPKGIADGISMLSDSKTRVEMSEKARLKALQYDWSIVLKPLGQIVANYLKH